LLESNKVEDAIRDEEQQWIAQVILTNNFLWSETL